MRGPERHRIIQNTGWSSIPLCYRITFLCAPWITHQTAFVGICSVSLIYPQCDIERSEESSSVMKGEKAVGTGVQSPAVNSGFLASIPGGQLALHCREPSCSVGCLQHPWPVTFSKLGKSKKRKSLGIYVYLWVSHIFVQQKPTQHCKAIILQLKKKIAKTKSFQHDQMYLTHPLRTSAFALLLTFSPNSSV